MRQTTPNRRQEESKGVNTSASILPTQQHCTADVCTRSMGAAVLPEPEKQQPASTLTSPDTQPALCISRDNARGWHREQTGAQHRDPSTSHAGKAAHRAAETMGKVWFPTGFVLTTSDPSRWRSVRTLLALL